MQPINEAIHSRVLRVRLDKTLSAGVPVQNRLCNLRCIWCHHDYLSHTDGQRKAISNQEFVALVSKEWQPRGLRIVKKWITVNGDQDQEAILRLIEDRIENILKEERAVYRASTQEQP